MWISYCSARRSPPRVPRKVLPSSRLRRRNNPASPTARSTRGALAPIVRDQPRPARSQTSAAPAACEKNQQMPHLNTVQFEPMQAWTNPTEPTQRGTNHGRQYGGQRMTPSQAPTRIGNSLKNLQQAPGGRNLHCKSFSILRTKNGKTFLTHLTP